MPPRALALYRLTHALPWPLLAAPAIGWLALPWLAHLLLDAATHRGPTGWRPFGIGRAWPARGREPVGLHVVLLSGGIDSAAVLARVLRDHARRDVVCVHVTYGQPHWRDELRAALRIGEAADVAVVVKYAADVQAMRSDGVVPGRNAVLLREARDAVVGASVLWFGTRNLFPAFDRFGDSSWVWARREARRLGVPVRTPVAGWPKWLASRWAARLVPASTLWSSEGYLPPRTTTQ